MYFIQPFAYFVLIVQVVLARSIESFHAPDALSSNSIAKRWIFNINGFPVRATGANPPGTRDITAEDVDRYIDQVAELSRLIVDNVRADDAIFLQFFGSADYYDNVMTIFRRVADIRNDLDPNNNNNFVINMDRLATPQQENDANGNLGTPIAQYDPMGDNPTLNLYRGWRALEDILSMHPGETSEGQLERFHATRQGAILHELMHYAGDVSRFLPVVPGYPYGEDLGGGRIVDLFLMDGVGGDETEANFAAQETRLDLAQLRGAVAYGERNVLLLAQLPRGPFGAIHNADTYTNFAIAILINWNRNRAITPTHGRLMNIYRRGDDRDPLVHTPSPFRGVGEENATRVSVWWKSSGRKEL